MKILAIETSCDDTGIAILEAGPDKNSPGRNSSILRSSATAEDGHEFTPFACPKISADFVSSQIKVHAPWGGVVPMLAKREHQRNLTLLLIKALKSSGLLLPEQAPHLRDASKTKKCQPFDSAPTVLRSGDKLQKILEREPELAKKLIPFLKKHQKPDIDYIAVTHGPGLEPALWVGVNFARALSYWWNIPLLPINHIEGHIAAAFAVSESCGIFNFQRKVTCQPRCFTQFSPLDFARGKIFKKILPAIALVVSGGHTQLILINETSGASGTPSEGRRLANRRDRDGVVARERGVLLAPIEAQFEYQIVGETRDDAAGEAFDKVAKMLNLGYPGGPAIAATAAKFKIENLKFKIKELPRPMLNSGDFDFSFSGLKTAVLYLLQKMTPTQIKKLTPAIAAEFQQAVIDVLTAKTLSAAEKYNAKTIILAGGVAANKALRQELSSKAAKLNLSFSVPKISLCMDNAAMIALAAYYQLEQKRTAKTNWRILKAQANLRIS